jgi:hypothetical protein
MNWSVIPDARPNCASTSVRLDAAHCARKAASARSTWSRRPRDRRAVFSRSRQTGWWGSMRRATAHDAANGESNQQNRVGAAKPAAA